MKRGGIIHPIGATKHEAVAIREQIKRTLDTLVHPPTAFLLAAVVRVLEEHKQFGKLTVRQMYYQLVARNVIKNSKGSYESFDRHLTTARRAGIIPWDIFEDRARMFHREPLPRYNINSEDNEQDALKSWFRYALNQEVSEEYDLQKWEGQHSYVELWVEKDALAGFLSPLCETLGVGLVVSRGYTSYTFKQEAIRRFELVTQDDRDPVLLYLGDLDPSGYDIYRCLEDEIGIAEVKRIGLHPEDVSQYDLVPNPIKDSDTRSGGFRRRFPELGDTVYELDALPPGELIDRARRNILSYFDESIHELNEQRVRQWRANFTDYQGEIESLLSESGIDI